MSLVPWLQPTFAQLVARRARGRLHHGLLLAGQAGIGKQQLAMQLAQALLCKQPSAQGSCGQCQSCHLFAAETHPDFSYLTSERQLGVDKVREGIGRLTATAQLNGNKVLCIPAAQTMTEAASNALLKTLEEPTGNTYLILVTDRLARLLPTIVSRCEKHLLQRPDEQTALQWLQQAGVAEATPALLAAYGGAPLHVQQALEDTQGISFRQFSEGLEALLAGQADAVTLASRWEKAGPQVAVWLQQHAHSAYCQHSQPQDFALYQACARAQQAMQNPGVNKIMILSSLLAELKYPANTIL